MCKRFIQARVRNTNLRLDCLDLHKVYFIHKKQTPPLPRYTDDDQNDDSLKPMSPTGTSISLEEAVKNMTDQLCWF